MDFRTSNVPEYICPKHYTSFRSDYEKHLRNGLPKAPENNF